MEDPVILQDSPRQKDVSIRLLSIDDVSQILDVQAEAYTENYLESEKAFAMKIVSAPDSCYGAFDSNQVMLGYAIAMPLRTHGMSIPLDFSDDFDGIVDIRAAACIYIHDVAIRQRAARTGLGTALYRTVLHLAEVNKIQLAELVAVQNAMPYWEKHGFVACGEAAGGYGSEARKMTRALQVVQ